MLCLNTWFPADGAIWGALRPFGGAAGLEQVVTGVSPSPLLVLCSLV